MRIFLAFPAWVGRPWAVLASLALALPAARAAHPLLTDDPGLQGAGHWQLEVNTDHTRTRDGGATFWARQVNTTLTRGLSDQVDVAFNLPLLRQTAPGEPTQSGVGDVGLQLKWRFYDNGRGWALGVRPTLALPTGRSAKGLGNGRAAAEMLLLSQLDVGDWTWLVNAGYVDNGNRIGARQHLWAASTALLLQVSAAWSVVSEVGAMRAADATGPGAVRFGLVGAVLQLNDKTDLDLGWRRSWGGAPRATTWGLGLTRRW
ncbi:transporter [Ottowia sp. GY511]|uniref:Transporter n=1 Tax=Ottowia flava TaxID=2675430 RepID=A0ABW4KW72_9BURK|nr:transporter [Ottowia sp. GY511]TXK23381.1 transporter [Ottowia sp. GY511]